MKSVQKSVSLKSAKQSMVVIKQVATKTKPKTKTAKLPFMGKAKKITGFQNKSVLKGKPVTKKTALKKVVKK